VTDFAVRGGQFDASGPGSVFKPHDFRDHFQRHRPETRHRRSDDATDPVPRFDTLTVSHQKPKGLPSPSAPAPIPSSSDPDELAKQGGTDELVRGYIAFLKSLREGGASDPEQLLNQADQLTHTVLDPLNLNEDDIAQLSIVSDFSMSEIYAAYAGADSSGAQAGVFYGAAADAHLRADIVTKDGRSFHVEVDLHAEVSVQAQAATQSGAQPQQADPLALDLDGDGDFSLSDPSGGILFDIDGDGALDQTAFITGSDGFLAHDRNGNGTIDDGTELFGDQHGAANGFDELAKYDDDGNGMIDRYDSIFENLKIVRAGQDGQLEQHSLAEFKVDSLSLNYLDVKKQAQGGNTITQTAAYFRSSSAYNLADITLGYRARSKEA